MHDISSRHMDMGCSRDVYRGRIVSSMLSLRIQALQNMLLRRHGGRRARARVCHAITATLMLSGLMMRSAIADSSRVEHVISQRKHEQSTSCGFTGCHSESADATESSGHDRRQRNGRQPSETESEALRFLLVTLDTRDRRSDSTFAGLQKWKRAVLAVAAFETRRAAAAEALTEKLRSNDPIVAQMAALSLAELGASAEPAVARLSTLLKHNDRRVREAAALALGEIGRQTPQRRAEIQRVLEQATKQWTANAPTAYALRMIDTDSELAKATFRKLLAEPTTRLTFDRRLERHNALRFLGRLGPRANSLLPTLKRMRKVKNRSVDWLTLNAAIVRIEPESASSVKALVDIMDKWDPSSQVAAATVLVRICGHRKRAFDVLCKHLKSDKSAIRFTAIHAMWKECPDTNEKVNCLIAALRDSTPLNRQIGCAALADAGATANRAAPHIARLLSDPVKTVRWQAQAALKKLSAKSRD